MRFKNIRDLNIWKNPLSRNQALVRSQYKTISKNGTVYPIFLGDSFLKTDIASMNLSVRSYNCLRRRGWETVGDIVNNISSIEEIRLIRNCGKSSSEEIFEQMIDLQKSLIPASDLPAYERIFNKVNGWDTADEEPRRVIGGNPAVGERRDIICKIIQM